MATSFDTTAADVIDTEDDDTIELQLSESALQALQAAADQAMAESDGLAAANDAEVRPARPHAPLKSGARSAVFFSVVAVGALLLTGVAYLAKSRTRSPAPAPVAANAAAPAAPTATGSRASASAIATTEAGVAEAPQAQAEEPAPVHFKNPFDRTEVFELPAGTSDADARNAVAEVLAQRALERHVELRKVPHRSSRTVDRNTPVTITKLTPQG